jgi:hypothetical protein
MGTGTGALTAECVKLCIIFSGYRQQRGLQHAGEAGGQDCGEVRAQPATRRSAGRELPRTESNSPGQPGYSGNARMNEKPSSCLTISVSSPAPHGSTVISPLDPAPFSFWLGGTGS